MTAKPPCDPKRDAAEMREWKERLRRNSARAKRGGRFRARRRLLDLLAKTQKP